MNPRVVVVSRFWFSSGINDILLLQEEREERTSKVVQIRRRVRTLGRQKKGTRETKREKHGTLIGVGIKVEIFA
jgi:hypothetical protein